ncbi:MAG: M23 family metallopeptidase [Acetobacteraceae bacterium]|nr:M23 family metallopeptidase [Acetobacteraceae bacterium]
MENTGGAPASGIQQHVVQPGETLWAIARQYGLTVESLSASNGLPDADHILPGQRLLVAPGGGAVHRVEPGDCVWRLARRYGVDADAIVSRNRLERPDFLAVGQLLVIPGAAAPSSQSLAAAQVASRPAALAWPVRGRISSYFGPRWGRRHDGVDIAAAYGTPIRAAAAGRVRLAGWMGGYGRTVIIDHSGGLTTLYGHASQLLVRAGQRVAAGETVARVGSSGNSTGPHLHFEVRVGGKARNPLNYLGTP